ncbi:hypothetical protein QWJ26_07060 [Streptomyces sp. CSDS2]|uniref:hypothetical protein n=1 Tax=Streptomyces sp. CSDS2 TaxID=3055051 RepID=UPI0025B164FB|nr:hypothetical protein [Streptomyces sp. CSDS2]MDN3259576.1 hypothetical protein [Streptomyces sp. CSDS2]
MADDATKIVAGTVGEDVLTVHKLRVLDERAGVRRPVCGAGKPGDETDEWSRAVNCRPCLEAPTE